MATEIVSVLREYATQKVRKDEEEYVAEMILAEREDNEQLESAALAPLLVESLDGVAWLEATKLLEISSALARVLTGDSADKSDETSAESLDEKVLAALKIEYAIDKSCLAVLEEDQDWHPARIRRHLDHAPTSDDDSTVDLHVEVEFIEFGKLQVVQLEEVVLADDVADDDDDDSNHALGPGRCEMCAREMRLTFHHLTPRVTHAKYLKMGYTKAFLNRGIRICRPCHNKIHASEDNKTLAREFNTLDKVVAHPQIARWISYASKQRSSINPLKKSKWPVGK